ncbi:hypothetical protein J6590_005252 [Homalodisca vitripennis]|nr:hypothetical protein J6590_005252 [Homalodisca vitripennis]
MQQAGWSGSKVVEIQGWEATCWGLAWCPLGFIWISDEPWALGSLTRSLPIQGSDNLLLSLDLICVSIHFKN